MSRTLKIFLAGFILFSIFYSTKRYHYFPLDGDLPAIVLNTKAYNAVMHDPFGMNVVLYDSVYASPNRYFAHKAMALWFLHVPAWFSGIMPPIDAVYYAAALAKTIFQFFILWLLAAAVTGRLKPWDPSTLLAAALLLPLFQTFGYNGFMGIIDTSVTYAFFYAGAFSLVLLFFLPGFLAWYHGQAMRRLWLLLPLAVVMLFNGPLNPGVMALLLAFWMASLIRKKLKAPGVTLHHLSHGLLWIYCIAFLLAGYSLYLGTHNGENNWAQLPLAERYARLPEGLRFIFTEKPGWPLLLAMVCINTILVYRRKADEKAAKILQVLRWVLLFSIVYLAVLPLGGYRSYRPNIVRMDTLLPVTLGIFLYYGLSTFYLLSVFTARPKIIYAVFICVFLGIFFNADLETRKYNKCEKLSLETLARSKENLVKLDQDCSVLSWGKTLDPADSELKGEMLYRWGITKDRKRFYQEP